ncbi:hypothetical protein [Riemerella anatipestifer]|uniref:hypothetical protein n=1 Tax=Riemerella anatipestifer TaxID=34085 RepID=UPI0023642784|nr:hypothetical protein [Riemerella anatipestifer]MDD1538287.1 hypothetical protein [Riemerella anatipestifer]
MKKIVLSAVVFVTALANAQVGINEPAPKATLDIKGKTDNTSEKVEGLLIPRVSINKALLMGNNTTPPQESTLVYVNDLSDYTTTPADAKVADITEKGYYFWNGTKWVRSAGVSASNDAIWVKDGSDARLAYPISNYVTKYFINGGYSISPISSDFSTIDGGGNIVLSDINSETLFSSTYSKSSDLIVKTGGALPALNRLNMFKINSDVNYGYWANLNITDVEENNILSGKVVYGDVTLARHFGNTRLGSLRGGFVSTTLGQNASADRLVGMYVDANSYSNNQVDDVYGMFNRVRLSGSGDIKRIMVNRSILRPDATNVTSNITDVYLNYVGYNEMASNYSGVIQNVYDFYAQGGHNIPAGTIINKYGVYITGPDKVNYFAGSLGIGTFTPTEKLEVAGNVKANSFMGTNGATIFPDYVFEKYYTGESAIKADYQFNSLAQVEDFVKANGHLPGYTSAKEIAKQGMIDIGATQITNVEKIEELYLHLLEKDKEVKELKAELTELKSLVKDLLAK